MVSLDYIVEQLPVLKKQFLQYADYAAASTEKVLKIFKAQKEKYKPTVAPGEMQTDHKTFMKLACADGYIALKEIQLEGKKKMSIEEFLRGYRV